MLVKESDTGGALVRIRPGDLDEPLPGEVRPRLKLIDDLTGEIQCEDCGRARGEAEEAWRKLEDAEKELRQYRARVRRLENEKAKERMEYLRRGEVQAVFDDWRVTCNHKRSKLTPDRFDAIQKVLEWDYTAEDIHQAISYVAAFPFVVDAVRKPRGKPAQRWDDIELVCRSGAKFEKFCNLGFLWLREQKRGAAHA